MARLLDRKDELTFSAKATSAIATSYLFVKYDTDRDYIVACGAGEDADGVLPQTAAAAEECAVVYAGKTLVRAGDTVANGADVMADSAGKAVTATPGNKILGKAIVGGGADELISVDLGRKPASSFGATIVAFGVATLVSGTKTVLTTAVAAGDKILLSRNTPGGTVGDLSAPAASIVAGTSFVINAAVNTDTSTVNWAIVR